MSMSDFTSNEKTKFERHCQPVLNISNEHTRVNLNPDGSLRQKFRKLFSQKITCLDRKD